MAAPILFQKGCAHVADSRANPVRNTQLNDLPSGDDACPA